MINNDQGNQGSLTELKDCSVTTTRMSRNNNKRLFSSQEYCSMNENLKQSIKSHFLTIL